jgi:hypothetical protein
MKKKDITHILLIFFFLAAFLRTDFVLAQSNAVQKAFLNVKDQIEGLISARDEGRPNELALRIEAMKKVIALSINEAQDLQLKLLAVDREDIDNWRKRMITELNRTLKFYAEKQRELENLEDVNLETLKNFAEIFKKWREENYLPLASQIRDFLLITEEQKSITIAEKRAQKISEDLRRLEKAKVKVGELKRLLSKANSLIEEAKTLNKRAETKFFDLYVKKEINFPEDSTSTATSSAILLEEKIISESASTSASTTSPTEEEPSFLLSIKDLVKSSLEKIKETYGIFIEMSNLVRKLL